MNYQHMLYAAIGASIALIVMRAEDKFNNQQYTHKQYIQVILYAFIITLIPIWLFSRSITTQLLQPQHTQYLNSMPAPSPLKPLNPTISSTISGSNPSLLVNSQTSSNIKATPQIGNGNTSAFFTPITNMAPILQFRKDGPTF